MCEQQCAAKACCVSPHPKLSLHFALEVRPLRIICAGCLLGEPENTLDEKSCLNMPSWLASPGCRLNLSRLIDLAFRLCKAKLLSWRVIKISACLTPVLCVCVCEREREDLVRSLILIWGMYVMPNRYSSAHVNPRKKTPNHDRYPVVSLSCTAWDVVLVCVCLLYVHWTRRDGKSVPMPGCFYHTFHQEYSPIVLMRETFAGDILWRRLVFSRVLHPSFVLVVGCAFSLRF